MNHIIQSVICASVILATLCTTSVTQAATTNTNVSQRQISDEHIIWQRTPIQITLPAGHERFVTFPSQVQFGYNRNLLPSSVLRVANDHHTLYLLAKKPFATQRVQAKLLNGEVILLDINARKQADDHPIDIVLPKKNEPYGNHESGHGDVKSTGVNMVSLMRYAIQQLYSPWRLLKRSNVITRFPMETTHIVPLFYDASALAMPLASWRGNDEYVTALLIKNLLDQPLVLDPRLLCGDWKAASFYPLTRLMSHGSSINGDTSTLFVVSTLPFSQALQACLNK